MAEKSTVITVLQTPLTNQKRSCDHVSSTSARHTSTTTTTTTTIATTTATKSNTISDPTPSTDENSRQVQTPEWQLIGVAEDLKLKKCQRVFCKKGSKHDLGLFYDRKGQVFHALGAWCGHMGGPLYEGDIEDYKGTSHVLCPWHAYMFDLRTGRSDIGLKQTTYPVQVQDGKVLILHTDPLSIHPYL